MVVIGATVAATDVAAVAAVGVAVAGVVRAAVRAATGDDGRVRLKRRARPLIADYRLCATNRYCVDLRV